jgi:hypothetical protein
MKEVKSANNLITINMFALFLWVGLTIIFNICYDMLIRFAGIKPMKIEDMMLIQTLTNSLLLIVVFNTFVIVRRLHKKIFES